MVEHLPSKQCVIGLSHEFESCLSSKESRLLGSVALPFLRSQNYSCKNKGLCSKFVHINCVDTVVDGPHGW